MKLLGLLGAAAAVGAAIVGYKYLTQANESRKDLENDFAECEGDEVSPEASGAAEVKEYNPGKKYTSLNANKDDFVNAARETFQAAKGMVEPVKGMAKDVVEIAKEKTGDTGVVISDYYNDAKAVVSDVVDAAVDKFNTVSETISNKVNSPAQEETSESSEDFVEFTDDFDDFSDEEEIVIDPTLDVDEEGNVNL